MTFTALTLPVSLDSLGEKRKRDVIGAAPGAAQFADHAHRAVGVARVNEDRRRALQFRIGAEPERNGVARAFVVGGFGVVVLGMKIVIQKDRVVRARAQQLLSFADVVGDVDKVAFEAGCKPAVPPFIIVQ